VKTPLDDLEPILPTIASYNASTVKIYYTTSSLVRFENINNFLYLENALAYYNARVVVLN
jgi:hypothetical protein